MKRTILLTIILLACLPIISSGQGKLLGKQVYDTAAACEKDHPAGFYSSAASFYAKGDKYGAGFLFYLGQLRYRYYCAANPNLPPDGDRAIMASLNSTVGEEINFYLGGHVDEYLQIVDAVIAWNKTHEYEYFPKTKDPKDAKKILDGLVKLRDYVAGHKKEMTAQHKETEEMLKKYEQSQQQDSTK